MFVQRSERNIWLVGWGKDPNHQIFLSDLCTNMFLAYYLIVLGWLCTAWLSMYYLIVFGWLCIILTIYVLPDRAWLGISSRCVGCIAIIPDTRIRSLSTTTPAPSGIPVLSLADIIDSGDNPSSTVTVSSITVSCDNNTPSLASEGTLMLFGSVTDR